MKKTLMILVTTTALAGAAWATGDHGKAATAMTDGQVTKVDAENRKLTLRHGEIRNLEMPPMTMVFQVRDVAMLAQVKAGDKIRFTADKVNGAFTVTTIEVVK